MSEQIERGANEKEGGYRAGLEKFCVVCLGGRTKKRSVEIFAIGRKTLKKPHRQFKGGRKSPKETSLTGAEGGGGRFKRE